MENNYDNITIGVMCLIIIIGIIVCCFVTPGEKNE